MRTEPLTVTAGATGEHEGHDAATIQALGFWIYLMSDLVLFSGLFATYLVLAKNYAGGPTGKDLFHLPPVLLETALLLCSSTVFGLAAVAVQKGDRRLVLAGLAGAFLLGLGFLAMEASEFGTMIREGAGPQRSGFLSAFFTLVGTHGLHVACGLLWMAVMMGQTMAKGLTAPVQARITRLGMFWHFLDIVWIFVFTVVYLMGVL